MIATICDLCGSKRIADGSRRHQGYSSEGLRFPFRVGRRVLSMSVYFYQTNAVVGGRRRRTSGRRHIDLCKKCQTKAVVAALGSLAKAGKG